MIYFLIFLAGGSGAVLRFCVDRLISERWKGSIPAATIFINATGSFLLGALTGALTAWAPTSAADSFVITENISLVLGAGLLGGYTTFSTALLEALRSEALLHRAVLLIGQALFCLLCAGIGLMVTQ